MSTKGFTMIEVLVSMSITAVLVISVYVSFSGILTGRSKIREITERERRIYFALEVIRNDLKNAFLTLNKGVPEETHKTVFISVEDDPVTHLTFTTINHVRMQSGVKQSDQTEIEYYGENVDGENVLFRRESLWIDEYPEKGGNVYPVFKGFKKLSLEYWNNVTGEWKADWDSESAENMNILPPKVKITLIAKEGTAGEEDYLIETVVNIKMQRALSF